MQLRKENNVISVFSVLQGSAETPFTAGEAEKYSIFQLPTFYCTFLPKSIKIPVRIFEISTICII